MAPAEGSLLEAYASVSDSGDDTVWTNADESDDGGTPAFDFCLEMCATGAKFFVGEFIGASGRAIHDVGDAEFEIEKQGFFKRRKDTRSEPASMQGGPETVAWTAEVVANGGGVQTRIDAGEEDDEVLGDEIRHKLVVRSEELIFGGFPGRKYRPIHRAGSLGGTIALTGGCIYGHSERSSQLPAA